ncbi:hypothetical protein [Embleya sp. NBC_00896]|uniref:hypothetical protein n=1 Tax=Embleya sp. NBC_00896 TaxID=2975961 RepID=UPI0038693B92|nr:hypothetical protein OG928_06570 [Embleya sp. NBC_00896]
MEPSDEAVRAALASLGEVLAADDFGLVVTCSGEGAVMLTVTAGPTACSTCLVPKEIMRRMAQRQLGALDRREWAIEIGYPADAGT